MLTNESAGQRAYIDIDIVFRDFMESQTWASIKTRLPAVEEYTGKEIAGLRVRPSSSGNCHIELTFTQDLSVMDNLCVRAWLNDDVHRLRLDLVRYLKTNNPARINRLWSGKFKVIDFKAELHLCDKWRNIPLDFMAAARAAWEIKKEETERSSAQALPGDPPGQAAQSIEDQEAAAMDAWIKEDKIGVKLYQALNPQQQMVHQAQQLVQSAQSPEHHSPKPAIVQSKLLD